MALNAVFPYYFSASNENHEKLIQFELFGSFSCNFSGGKF